MIVDDVKAVLIEALSLSEHAHSMGSESRLLGALPELDSMAVVNLVSALEEHFGIAIADEEISAPVFQTLGSLAAFVEGKRA